MSSKKCAFAIFIYCIKTDSYCLSELLVVVGKVCENHMPDCPSLLSFLVTRDSLVLHLHGLSEDSLGQTLAKALENDP